MKKRILLSLVSFFAMTAMWASLTDAYQIYVAAANGKTGATAELTISMKNKEANIGTWVADLTLPEGVTFESIETIAGRYPEGYNAVINAVSSENVIHIVCEGEEGVALTGTDGAVAKVIVKIDADVTPGNYTVKVANALLTTIAGDIKNGKEFEFTWTIEQGEEPGIRGDLNGDTKVDIADAVSILNIMAEGTNDPIGDLNGDGKVDIADFVTILNIMAEQ